MKDRERLEELKKEISKYEKSIRDCKHSFNKPIYDPESVMEGYGSVQDGGGSDPHWGFEGYKEVTKDRWSRECEICGEKQYTYKREPVITSYEPKF